jgi:hypothetical protein
MMNKLNLKKKWKEGFHIFYNQIIFLLDIRFYFLYYKLHIYYY